MRRNQGKPAGRSELARVAHFRGGAGAMGGNKKQQARRKRRETKAQEQQAAREHA
jgi:hypothetical protein